MVPATIAVPRSSTRSAISISSTTVTAPTTALNNSPTIGWTPKSQYSPPSTVLKPGGQRAVGPPVNGTYPSPLLRFSAVLWYMSASLNANPLRSIARTQVTRTARASVNSATCGNHLRATSERSRPRDTTGIVAARTASGAGSQRVGSLNGSSGHGVARCRRSDEWSDRRRPPFRGGTRTPRSTGRTVAMGSRRGERRGSRHPLHLGLHRPPNTLCTVARSSRIRPRNGP